MEQAEYQREKIAWDSIDFEDNQVCLDLIEGRNPPGLLAMLDEECLVPRGNDKSYAAKVAKQLKQHPRLEATSRLQARGQFAVLHYAGRVVYVLRWTRIV